MRSRLVRDSHAAEFLKRLPNFLLDCPKYAAFIVISFINNVSTKTFEKTIVALCLGYLFVALGYGRKVKIIFQISISGTKWCMRKNISSRPKTKKRSQNFNTAPSGRVIIWYFRSIDGWPRCLRGLGTKKSPNTMVHETVAYIRYYNILDNKKNTAVYIDTQLQGLQVIYNNSYERSNVTRGQS